MKTKKKEKQEIIKPMYKTIDDIRIYADFCKCCKYLKGDELCDKFVADNGICKYFKYASEKLENEHKISVLLSRASTLLIPKYDPYELYKLSDEVLVTALNKSDQKEYEKCMKKRLEY